MKTLTPVFVVSLHSPDHPGNMDLANRLRSAFAVTFVQGVRGRSIPAGEYFDLIQNYRQKQGRMMTPSEVGCALSHLSVYRLMVQEALPVAVILEDDVLLDSLSIDRINYIIGRGLSDDGFVSLGGQEGTEHLISLAHGSLVDAHNELWELMLEDVGRLQRTVGYVISNAHAKSLLSLAERGVFTVDDYSFISAHTDIDRFYLCNCVGHPPDLALSTIEPERTINRKSFSQSSKPLARRLAEEIRATAIGRKSERAYRKKASKLANIHWKSRFHTARPAD